MKKLLTNVALFCALGFAGIAAHAADAPKLDSGSTGWMITASVLVILMTIPGKQVPCGLAIFFCVTRQTLRSNTMRSLDACLSARPGGLRHTRHARAAHASMAWRHG